MAYVSGIKVGDTIIDSLNHYANSVVSAISSQTTNFLNQDVITTNLFTSLVVPVGAITINSIANGGAPQSWVIGQ